VEQLLLLTILPCALAIVLPCCGCGSGAAATHHPVCAAWLPVQLPHITLCALHGCLAATVFRQTFEVACSLSRE